MQRVRWAGHILRRDEYNKLKQIIMRNSQGEKTKRKASSKVVESSEGRPGDSGSDRGRRGG
jgi:hypothetical protein